MGARVVFKWRRGGNQWHHQMKTQPAFKLTPGRQLSLVATVDVIRDLGSLENCVKVTPPQRAVGSQEAHAKPKQPRKKKNA